MNNNNTEPSTQKQIYKGFKGFDINIPLRQTTKEHHFDQMLLYYHYRNMYCGKPMRGLK